MRNNKSALTHDEITSLLMLQEPKDIDDLFARARKARQEHYGNKVFLYGFVYFSTFCRNNCSFCYYRNTNSIERYRKNEKDIVEHSIKLAESGVNLIDLTMGEDLQYRANNFKAIGNIIKTVKDETGLPIMISPGIANEKAILAFAKAGTDFYALYQETFNKNLFEKLRLSQNFDDRLKSKEIARKYKLLVEEGILTGVGESINDIADSIIKMGQGGATQIRVMTFVPQEGIPLHESKNKDPRMEEKIIAVMRIAYPNSLIPASLDIEGIGGLKSRLLAGANIVTSIIPPMSGLQGVAQSIKDVDEGGRTVLEVSEILSELGMKQGSNEDFKTLIDAFKQEL
jgi:methylornithine synthase